MELQKMEDTLVKADWNESKQLTFRMVPRGNHRHKAANQQRLEDIHHFLQHMEWQTGTTDNPNGVTWLELMIMLEVMGGDRMWTKERKQK